MFPSDSSNGSQMCLNIAVIDDKIVEQSEIFFVVLATNDTKVNIVNSQLQITIDDNDGEYITKNCK